MSGALRSGVGRWLARGYVAGPELVDALALAERLGLPSTLAYWDAPEDSAERIVAAYGEALDTIARLRLDSYVSVKAPSLPDDAVAEVVSGARAAGVLLHFDSLGRETAERTLRLALEAASAGAEVGATLPGAWARSDADAERLAAAGIRLRLVRGQWPGERDGKEGVRALAERVAGVPTAVGTHDTVLARDVLATLAGRGGVESELELLYGLPLRPSLALARELGAGPPRVYLAYGRAWLPYALSQVRRNPRIAWWVARDTALGRRRI